MVLGRLAKSPDTGRAPTGLRCPLPFPSGADVNDDIRTLLAAGDLEGVLGLVDAHGPAAVASALVDNGSPEAVAAARAFAGDDRASVRAVAVTTLRAFGTNRARLGLFDILVTTTQPDTRRGALEALIASPPPGVGPLCVEAPARSDYNSEADDAVVELLSHFTDDIEVRDHVTHAVREWGSLVGARAMCAKRPFTGRILGMELRRHDNPLQRQCAAHLLQAGSSVDVNVVFPLRDLVRDQNADVGRAAATSLLAVDPKATDWARNIITSTTGALPAMRVLGVVREARDLPQLVRLAGMERLSAEVLEILATFDRPAVLAQARALVTASNADDRKAAAALLAVVGESMDVPAFEHLTHDADASVRQRAFGALLQRDAAVARARAHDFVESGPHAQAALGLLAERSDAQAVASLRGVVWDSRFAAGVMVEALRGSSDEGLRAACLLHQAIEVRTADPKGFKALLAELEGPLAGPAEAEFRRGLAKASGAPLAALVLVAGEASSALFVPALLEYYEKQGKGSWAATVLRAFGSKPHPRAEQEVLVALGERDKDVREAAEEMLRVNPPPSRPKAFWIGFLADWERLKEWTELASWEFLGGGTWLKPVREGVGLTWFSHAHAGSADVEVTVQPLLDGREEAWDVIRGVVIHEFGHHTYDFRRPGFKSANGNAAAAGVKPIFDLLLDERLERNLRAHDPFYGKLIDRANAYFRESPPIWVGEDELVEAVGAEKVAAWVQATGVDLSAGKVALSAWDAALIPDLMPRLDAFYVGLLVVRNPARFADPLVREALELVPANLKDCDHADLYRLSVAVGELLDVKDNGERARRRRQRMRSGRLGRHVQSALCKAGAATGIGTGETSHSASSKASVQAAQALRAKLSKRRAIRPPRRGRLTAKAAGGQDYNAGSELDFAELAHEITLDADPQGFRALVRENRKHVSGLRRHFELLGSREVERRAQSRGHRLDVGQVRRLVTRPTTQLLVRREQDVGANAYIGLLIDRSGSMHGEKITLARRFAALLTEAAGGVRGLVGHVNAFDDDTFYRLGDFRRNAIARLESGGGNNDAGGLLRAAQLAEQSGMQNRLLVMISDGSPTECTVAALANLVQFLGRRKKIACAQVCVDRVRDRVFPVTLDVRQLGMDASVHEFGRLLVRLTRAWR